MRDIENIINELSGALYNICTYIKVLTESSGPVHRENLDIMMQYLPSLIKCALGINRLSIDLTAQYVEDEDEVLDEF